MLLSASRAARKTPWRWVVGSGWSGISAGDLEPQRNPRDIEELAGKGGDVVDERPQGVLARIHRPDDFIEAADDVFGLDGKLVERRLQRGLFGVLGGERGEDGNLGEAGAQIVVQVAGDAGALAFPGIADFQQLDAALHPQAGGEPAGAGRGEKDQPAHRSIKPGGLPEIAAR